MPKAIAVVGNSKILANYQQYRQKMDLYRQDIEYGSSDWVKGTSYQEVTAPWEDQ